MSKLQMANFSTTGVDTVCSKYKQSKVNSGFNPVAIATRRLIITSNNNGGGEEDRRARPRLLV